MSETVTEKNLNYVPVIEAKPEPKSVVDYISEPRKLDAPRADATPEELYNGLIRIYRSYKPEGDTELIKKAYEVACRQHKDQKRKSGEPYIIHPLNTAIIIAEIEMDKEAICAALLHDVVEDTNMTLDEIREMFGDHVALLVDGVTKLTQLSLDVDKIEIQAENLRKMFVAMAKDIRVVLIKLADRLHNLRTLQYQSKAKQIEKATETMEIYSPLAERLGIMKLKIELDDISLKYLKPDVYYDLVEKIALKREEREAFISDIEEEVSKNLEEAGIHAVMTGRVKHFFSIYKKMINQNKTVDQIYDLFAVRILVESVKDCYAALGVIHEMYKPIPGRFKDYIAMPKPNMYQSLHTTLIGRDGTPFEIQIRTFEMHKVAEYGIAAHWKYKESGGSQVKADSENDEKMSWLREVLEWQKDADDNKDFLNMVKSDFDLFNDNVYCFTPSGDVKSLPSGSTPIDFAYSIHSAVGNKMVGARVNERIVPIDYKLKNGDRVEIITSQNSKGPSMDWLNLVRSTQAKSKINAWFKTTNKEDNILRGRDILDKYCKSKGFSYGDLTKPEFVEAVLRRYAMHDWDAVLASVGHGGLKEGQIIGKLLEAKKKHEQERITDEQILAAHSAEGNPEISNPTVKKALRGGILVKGVNDLSARCAHCCNPVPGDEIVGFVTRGRGITVHRTDCINMINLPQSERTRLIEAEWDVEDGTDDTYSAEIKIFCNNRIGMLADISRIFTDLNIDITSINLKNAKNGTCTTTLTFDIHGRNELTKIIDKLRTIPDIIDISRTAG
ncbi:MAG: bifunctional (p)ppGpp synthetase/guanosine-3',5'-bis(diphosphate) 3'-pyrophosphohydrolase [Lachnospiraceae bacterium]|nr:bifunctional (p)ppGpp synthetase/guanosine-3',5'-bis(diphosphate) 3'-pyrophosphohydrolase [Lachnospiraceae bacterium]